MLSATLSRVAKKYTGVQQSARPNSNSNAVFRMKQLRERRAWLKKTSKVPHYWSSTDFQWFKRHLNAMRSLFQYQADTIWRIDKAWTGEAACGEQIQPLPKISHNMRDNLLEIVWCYDVPVTEGAVSCSHGSLHCSQWKQFCCHHIVSSWYISAFIDSIFPLAGLQEYSIHNVILATGPWNRIRVIA